MIFLNRDIFAKCGKLLSVFPLRHKQLLLILIVSLARAGSFSSSDFSVFLDSGNVDVTSDSIQLSVKRYIVDKAYGDAGFKTGLPDSSYSCDALAYDKDEFGFFWAQPSKTFLAHDDIYRQNVTIHDAGYDAKPNQKVFENSRNRTIYLDAVAGESEWLLNFIDKDGSQTGSGPIALYYDTYQESTLVSARRNAMSSICYHKNNQYLISYRNHGGSKMYIANVISDNNLSDGIKEYEFTDICDGASDWGTNPTIASDGTSVLMVRTSGAASGTKTLHYHLFNSNNNYTSHTDAVVMSNVAIDGASPQSYDFPESQVVSYADRKFAMITWRDGEGIFLDTVAVNSTRNNFSRGITNINSSATARWATIGTNGKILVVAWKGLMVGDPSTTIAVRGFYYNILNDTIDWANKREFMFSDSGVDVDINNPGLDIAVDKNGSMAFAWTQHGVATGCVWSYRGERFETGFWSSPVESILVTSGDSLQILSGGSTFGLTTGDKKDSIRVGPSAGTFAGWSDWADLSNSAELFAKTANTHKYFQFKTSMIRTYRTATASIKSYNVSWNIQPQFDSITSIVTTTNGTLSGVNFGDTVSIYSRLDTIGISYTAHDNDTANSFFSSITWSTVMDKVILGDVYFTSNVTLSSVNKSDTVYTCKFNAHDDLNWAANEKYLYVRTKNFVPVITLKALWDKTLDNVHDTTLVSMSQEIYLQEDDSLNLLYNVAEINDMGIKAYVFINSKKVDSTTVGTEKSYFIKSNQFVNPIDTVRIWAEDADTSVEIKLFVKVNHFPVISNAKIDGANKRSGDKADIVIGTMSSIEIFVADTNVSYWDTITYEYITPTFDTITHSSSLSFIPTKNDVWLRVIAKDLFNKSDTTMYYFNYPAYEISDSLNNGYILAKDTLINNLSLIVGGGVSDTVDVPIMNSGNVNLSLYPIIFGANSSWLKLGIWQNNKYVFYDSLDASSTIHPVVVPQNDTGLIKVLVDPATLSGDGVVYDSIFISTNDPVKPYDTIPIVFEYNELPRIVSLNLDFNKNELYTKSLAKIRKVQSTQNYKFPPHARIKLKFSEPMDSASAVGKIRMYSILDSAYTGTVSEFIVHQTWDSTYTTLYLRPEYQTPSSYFGGLKPSAGLFIPTDSIRLIISSDITDTAKTPSGPNTIDIDQDYIRDIGEDSTFALRVDSINFTINEVYPKLGSMVNINERFIKLTFSAPIYPGTIDTSLVNNKSLIVSSKYLSDVDSNRRIQFDSVYTIGNTAWFLLNKNYFYGDSIFCNYRSFSARDSLGYPADINSDGIPISMFDSVSTADDFTWYFNVRNIHNVAVYPHNEETSVPISAPIVLAFDNIMSKSLIDTSLSNNQTLNVTSNYSGGSQMNFDKIVVADTAVSFYLHQRLFYDDSVHCVYNGLVTNDTSLYSVLLNQNSFYTTSDKKEWYFTVEKLSLNSVTPDSASIGANIHSSITMEFSGPVSPQIFDTTIVADSNKSFMFNSLKTGKKRLSYDRIDFSSDSTRITFYPTKKFFAEDSVFCNFFGFSNNYRYGTGLYYLPTAGNDVHGEYSWFFIVENSEFYTFPNPYKPGSDARHKKLGGIWFKNLHTLNTSSKSILLRIYTINTVPVFDSYKANKPIILEENGVKKKPLYFWDTRNTSGELVGSGVYLYALLDENNKVLKKGKILIVR